MNPRAMAATLATVTLALLTGTIVLWAVNDGAFYGEAVFSLAAVVVFTGLGGLLTIRRPQNPVSWLVAVTGLLLAVNAGAWELLTWAKRGVGPGAYLGEFLTGVGFFGTVTVLGALLPLRFPTGRPPTPRWRWAERGALLGLVLVAGTSAISVADLPRSQLGTGVPLGGEHPVLVALGLVGSLLIPAGALAALVSVGVRWRRSVGIERQQLRCLLLPLVPLAFGIAVELTVQGPVALALLAVGLLAVPAGISVAILKHRLYEIDRILSRTVTYGLVTAVLVGVYALVAVVPAALFDLQSDLLVAGATLVAAAAFGPVRQWVQTLVDRRFNRTGYDAAQVAERFAERLREEVDLDQMTTDLCRVVATTVQPTNVSLWMEGHHG